MGFGLLLTMCLASVVLATPAPGASPPLEIDRKGVWTFARLGARDIHFTLHRDVERRSIHFQLPPGARQGRSAWYLMRLHFVIVFAPKSGPGSVVVSGLTNGHAAAQVQIDLRRTGNGQPVVRWHTLDYIRGHKRHRAGRRSVDVRFENYVQYRGLHGGGNTFTVQLEQLDPVTVESLMVFADSGLEVSSLGPAKLQLKVEPRRVEAAQGEEFAIRYELRNAGDRPALGITVAPDPATQLELLGRRRHSMSQLDDVVTGAFRFRALKTGIFPLGIFVSSGTNQPGQLVEVRVSPRRSIVGAVTDTSPRIAGLLLLVGGIMTLRPAIHHKRRKREQ